MSAANFPTNIWDGSARNRPNPNKQGETPLETYRGPDPDDYLQTITEIVAIETNLKNIVGSANSAALATTATAGFGHMPTCAGAPTGVPATIYPGYVPFVYDTTNHKIWIYDGGAWKYAAMT